MLFDVGHDFDPRKTLARRDDNDLPFVEKSLLGGQGLLLDTCVYIHQMQGRAPAILVELIQVRRVHHSTVAIQELMHSVGALDPTDPRTARALTQIRHHIDAMPVHRICVPDADILGRAGLLSGMLCRLQGYTADHRLRAFQDCVLFLQAHKLGFTVLTSNISDYDFLLQLIPTGRVLMYRTI